MKTVLKICVIFTGLLLTISAFGYLFWYKPKFSTHLKATSFTGNTAIVKSETLQRLKQKALLAKNYITDHGFNSAYCFLLDMHIASGKNRFFVYNLDKDSVEITGLVAHGSGSDNGTDELSFSNLANSNCTSLGKYKIGNSYTGRFGLAYKLYGLDKTNSNAFDRFVVLHAHECVPNGEVSPLPICESWGCPTVSPPFLAKLKTYLDRSWKPVLLWIYY